MGERPAVTFPQVRDTVRTLRSVLDRDRTLGDVRRVLDQMLGVGVATGLRRYPDAVAFTVRLAELDQAVTVTVTEKGGWVTVRL